MKVPFPHISSQLAIQEHMYICYKAGSEKQFFKCQTYKPMIHRREDKPPFNYIVERKNPDRNPFDRPETLIDLDKTFLINGLKFLRSCLTTNRTDICRGLYSQIKDEIVADKLENELLENEDLKILNSFLK